MNLYTSAASIESHRTRIVLNEKDIVHEITIVDPKKMPEERFPHPPLMPVGPVQRAQTRMALFQVEHDWYPLVEIIETKGEKAVAKAKKELADSITSIAEIFTVTPYFLSEDFTLVDASVAPILWRLRHYGIELPAEAKAVNSYAERLFEREGFILSLTESERELRL
jgi:RNA polymerase-associated protein